MKTLHLVGAILGFLTLLCAIIAVAGVNKGWLDAPNGSISCGTIKCSGNGGSAKVAAIGCKKSFSDGAKAALAVAVIAMVLALVGLLLAVARTFDVGGHGLRMLTCISAILFVFVMILLLAAWAVYLGVFIAGCCTGGRSCSADGGFAFGAAITGMILAIPTFIILFIAFSKEGKQ